MNAGVKVQKHCFARENVWCMNVHKFFFLTTTANHWLPAPKDDMLDVYPETDVYTLAY